MDEFRRSCRNAASYPTNLLSPNIFPYELELFRQRLSTPTTQNRLCYDQKDGQVSEWGIHIWEKQDPGQKYASSIASTIDELRLRFQTTDNTFKHDPLSRFMFLHARNARQRLNVTMPMLQHLLSHHQIAPFVIDQLLSYGRRKSEQDFTSRLFYSETCISLAKPLSDLARSNSRFQVGYTLRSIEDPQNWTMRQASVYHSFDMGTGRSFWLVVKASANIRERLQQVTSAVESGNGSTIDSPARLLAKTLPAHLVMCNWANENWRSYLQELESDVHLLTKPAVVYDHKAFSENNVQDGPVGTATLTSRILTPVRSSTLQRASTLLSRPFSRNNTGQFPIQQTAGPAVVADEKRPDEPEIEAQHEDDDSEQFSVTEMQRIQAIEEKLNSTLLVLKCNSDALSQLQDFYASISNHYLNGQSCLRKDVDQFSCVISNILSDLKMQTWRLETLQKLLSDRKVLFNAIIEYRNAEATRELARRAQKSQDNMEKMTNQMSDIAEKTQQETVSMRIITLVTLFFLPGTFISTLMSTSIIQFDPDEHGQFKKIYSAEALSFFFKISAPLMVATFVAWYATYLWVNHRQSIRKTRLMQRWQQFQQSNTKALKSTQPQDQSHIV